MVLCQNPSGIQHPSLPCRLALVELYVFLVHRKLAPFLLSLAHFCLCLLCLPFWSVHQIHAYKCTMPWFKSSLFCALHRISCFHSTLHDLFLYHLSSWTTIAHLSPRRPRIEKKTFTILSFSTLLEDSADHSAAEWGPTQPSRQLLLISSLDLTLTLKPYDMPSFLQGTNHSHLHNGRPRKWLHRKLTQ